MLPISKYKILVAPLDWGLGHTTRCIPIIEALQQKGAEVILAGNNIQKNILSEAFPQCQFLSLDGYNVVYSSSGKGLFAKMLQQVPQMMSAIRTENIWLQKTVTKWGIDGVISDNRFGLYHSHIPSVFITHQLQLQTGNKRWLNAIARAINYKKINRFNLCWIPDFDDFNNLAGELSHPVSMPKIPHQYIGSLSRMKKVEKLTGCDEKLLVLLSGPEPQRSIFEKIILNQAPELNYPVVIVRGLPLSTEALEVKNATVFNHVAQKQLATLMQQSAFVICRSGYSSVMDINAVSAKSILIPTPGQTEQEYLAKYLMQKQFALCGSQSQLHLSALIKQAAEFNYAATIAPNQKLLTDAIEQFLKMCRK